MYDTTWIKQSLGSDWKAFEDILKTALDSSYSFLSSIDTYILNKPGKQLRPALALCSARICGTPVPLSHAVAAVAEMIHTASLLHDDVADNAEMRRGVLSVQKQFGARASVLLGDYWFGRAFKILLQYEGMHLLPLYVNVIDSLSEGEILQMEKARTLDLTLNEYYTICENKTASLFRTSMLSGALSVPQKEISSVYRPVFEKVAFHMGMAFQIHDDMTDYRPVVDSKKQAYLDITDSKITLPLLGALANAGDVRYRPHIVEWVRELGQGDQTALDRIVSFIDKYEGMEYAARVLDYHILQAQDQLSRLPDSQWRDYLLKISGM
ncbi:MAG TPA: polyprenyl synthetase family protein [Bacteroidales bacterium]|nr:MAG: All-trans-nonaprenyl-diphosphate synthase (geranyl-diphosphate specific) [Bacteroidetes bacterium ADurb.Bin037]HPV88617.1 polyprenyl synthetase family protein [Bacteroidales bacterium]HPW78493.1 polyprenyl synthetase family protein [Bacteroidales bacterium]HQB55704.1 polyprenyl synthetase family protein [Bacteroidales bacterium]